MAKKLQGKNFSQQNPAPFKPTPPASTGSRFLPAARDIIPFVLCLLYLAVEFLPGFGAIDDMGTQWLYLVILDLAVVIYIFDRKNDFEFPAASLFKNTFSRLYLALFVVAGISVFYAINRSEAWVSYARFIATIIGYFNIAILLYGRTHLFKLLAQILALVLLLQSLESLYLFFTEMSHYRLVQLVLSMKGRAGNKNIFSASLMAKVPFVLYCIYSFGSRGKLFNTGILILSTLTIFLINSRTTYLALILEMIIFLFFCIQQYIKGKDRQQNIYRISYVLVSITAAFFISLIAISAARSSFVDDGTDVNQYGSVTDRLSSITAAGDDSREQRLFLWRNASEYIKTHPFVGCGYGNWKIASIPYTKELTNDLMVPVHAHNDFLEYFAELGVAGGLLYISLFVCILVYTLKTWLSKADEETKIISAISMVALAGYFVDAFFNFPIERPVNQVFFVFIVALNVTALNKMKEEEAVEPVDKKDLPTLPKSAFALTALLMLLPAAYITYLTYQSLVVQNRVIPDLSNEPLKLPLNDVINAFPTMPNLTSSAQPIEAIIGRYLYEAKRYKEAIVWLDKGAKANPYIMYSEFLKADVYYADNQDDSAFKYATMAYFNKPRAKTYFQTLVAVCAKRKDTVTLRKAFRLFTKYRPNEAFGYNFFLMGMLNAKQVGSPELLALADSVIKVFPDDKELKVRRNELFGNMPGRGVANAQVQQTNDVAMANQLFAEGTAAFNKGDFNTAAQKFIRSSQISNGTYGVYENIAICFFNLKQWDKSLPYFDRVLAMRTSTDGKSEYFKGAALINMGRPDEACALLKLSKTKNYPGADALITTYCAGK